MAEDKKKKFAREFENMLNFVKLKALSSMSLKRSLTNEEFLKIMKLRDEVFKKDTHKKGVIG